MGEQYWLYTFHGFALNKNKHQEASLLSIFGTWKYFDKIISLNFFLTKQEEMKERMKGEGGRGSRETRKTKDGSRQKRKEGKWKGEKRRKKKRRRKVKLGEDRKGRRR